MEENPTLTTLLNQEEYEKALKVKDEMYHGMKDIIIGINRDGKVFYNTYKA